MKLAVSAKPDSFYRQLHSQFIYVTPYSRLFLYCHYHVYLGGFTIFSRLNTQWQISAWDITALRFGLAFLILMPVLLYKKDTAFLWQKHSVILALIGGVGYCLTAYTAFLYAPAAHAAIFLNGCIPLTTAVAAWILFKQPFDKHTWISLSIMLTALGLMSFLISQSSSHAFGKGDVLLFISAIWWGLFTVLLKQWRLSAWHSMASVLPFGQRSSICRFICSLFLNI